MCNKNHSFLKAAEAWFGSLLPARCRVLKRWPDWSQQAPPFPSKEGKGRWNHPVSDINPPWLSCFCALFFLSDACVCYVTSWKWQTTMWSVQWYPAMLLLQSRVQCGTSSPSLKRLPLRLTCPHLLSFPTSPCKSVSFNPSPLLKFLLYYNN